jgi:Domain of Unknown Function with PDB structure (DUF3857)/Transglutaminase-like superfamily
MGSTGMAFRCIARRGFLIAAASLCAIAAAHADDWLPIAPEELQLADEPAAPKASAIYLYRQVDRSDRGNWERVYVRIKILTDEGRSQGSVVIKFDKEREIVHDIEARTVRPDGSIVKFDGTVYEKPLLEGRGVRAMTKTFSLPEVQPGCIIEYRYERLLSGRYVFSSEWIVSADLYTKVAKFSLIPNGGYLLRTTTPAGLPPATIGPKYEHGLYTMVTRDVPAFVTEEYMLPEDELKMRVDFVYLRDSTIDKDAATFWNRWGKQTNSFAKRYMDEPRAMQGALAQIAAPTDSPEQKLRKIYARVGQLRNLSFERRKSAEEAERESAKDNEDVADVWKHGYGNEHQITLLFVALARAAGFEADPVALSTRSRFLFNEQMRNPGQLNTAVAVVKLGDQDIFLAPGIPFAPFGTLAWNDTAVKGLRLNDSGGVWVTTPLPPAPASRLERKATLHLTPDAGLEGTVTFTFTGLDALGRRLEERNEDDTERRRRLEDEVKGDMNSAGEVTLTNAPEWSNGDAPLVAIFNVKVPGWGRLAGTRALVPVDIFAGGNRHVFEHATRVHPVYFHFPHQLEDDVTIDLPAGWTVGSVPQPGSADIHVADCKWTADGTPTTLHLKRYLTIDTLLINAKYYGQLQDFFQAVRRSAEEEAVVSIPLASTHAASTGL